MPASGDNQINALVGVNFSMSGMLVLHLNSRRHPRPRFRQHANSIGATCWRDGAQDDAFRVISAKCFEINRGHRVATGISAKITPAGRGS
jgi:hypothetical protein